MIPDSITDRDCGDEDDTVPIEVIDRLIREVLDSPLGERWAVAARALGGCTHG